MLNLIKLASKLGAQNPQFDKNLQIYRENLSQREKQRVLLVKLQLCFCLHVYLSSNFECLNWKKWKYLRRKWEEKKRRYIDGIEWRIKKGQRGKHGGQFRRPATRSGRFFVALRWQAFCTPVDVAGRGFFPREQERINAVIRADEEQSRLPLVWERVAIKRTTKSQRGVTRRAGEGIMLGATLIHLPSGSVVNALNAVKRPQGPGLAFRFTLPYFNELCLVCKRRFANHLSIVLLSFAK